MARRRGFKLSRISVSLSRRTRTLFKSLTNLRRLLPAISAPSADPLGRTTEITDFGSNPGELRMFLYTPDKPVHANAPLIMVLHGCGQFAESFAAQSGWIALANQLRVPLLLPEQTTSNNAGRCFNWYRPADTRRGQGEAMSVRQMLRTAIERFSSDKRRIFVVGLSAGGAFAASLLAAYPALFNAGAVAAGMPVGAASNAASALIQMRHANPLTTRASLASAVKFQQPATQRPRKKWPRITIWHGGQDHTIDPANGHALAAQWSELHGFTGDPNFEEISATGTRRQVWGSAKLPSVEYWTIPAMAHGFPIDAALSGQAAFGVIDAGISASHHIARFWGLEV